MEQTIEQTIEQNLELLKHGINPFNTSADLLETQIDLLKSQAELNRAKVAQIESNLPKHWIDIDNLEKLSDVLEGNTMLEKMNSYVKYIKMGIEFKL